MRKIIHHLRQQPEHVKRGILHIFTATAAVVLFFIWIYSFGMNLTSEGTQAKMERDLKPFSALKGNMLDGYNSITKPDLNILQ